MLYNKKNIFTIDTEDWYHANYEDNLFENSSKIKSTVVENTHEYLDSFDKFNVKATFFILGFVAEEHPDLVREIHKRGHEIASHGYGHKLVYKQTKEEFREDIRKSKIILEDLIGEEVKGYRAPSWSITKKSLWALEELTKEGYKYDSSIFPFENFLYGIKNAPRTIYNGKIFNENADIIEIPPTTFPLLGQNIPFSGGFYFRTLPRQAIKTLSKILVQKDENVLYYLHPREIDINQPRLKLNKRDNLIHYYGIKSCKKKFEYILNSFEFDTIANIINLK